MKVSIIISNYNYARYLTAAVDSVFQQTYQDFEVIIVDDGSTDNSCEVITKIQQKYTDKIRVIFQANQGQGGAFNAGFAASTGNIISFLDADDVWHPDKLERIVAEFQNPEIAGVMHQLVNIDADGNSIDSEQNQFITLPDDLGGLIAKTGNAWFFPPTSALSYRRESLALVFPIDTVKWRIWADGCIIYCASFTGKVKTISQVLGGYRIHGANNHAKVDGKPGNPEKDLTGIEMTNAYINEFLEKINHQQRVNLANNLQYQRTKYYFNGVFDRGQAWHILKLIANWPLYSWKEKLVFMARFSLKNIKMVGLSLQPISGIVNN